MRYLAFKREERNKRFDRHGSQFKIRHILTNNHADFAKPKCGFVKI
jgi:hypothetical protein